MKDKVVSLGIWTFIYLYVYSKWREEVKSKGVDLF